MFAVFAEILAVGVPLLTFKKPNLAEVVALLPSKRSCVPTLSKILPFAWSNGEPPLATGRIPEISLAPPERFTEEVVSTPDPFV